MKKFMDGEINILVSTTVVEVGIDNPNVNVILINNTERLLFKQLVRCEHTLLQPWRYVLDAEIYTIDNSKVLTF